MANSKIGWRERFFEVLVGRFGKEPSCICREGAAGEENHATGLTGRYELQRVCSRGGCHDIMLVAQCTMNAAHDQSAWPRSRAG